MKAEELVSSSHHVYIDPTSLWKRVTRLRAGNSQQLQHPESEERVMAGVGNDCS